jgi:hypothetical protein
MTDRLTSLPKDTQLGSSTPGPDASLIPCKACVQDHLHEVSSLGAALSSMLGVPRAVEQLRAQLWTRLPSLDDSGQVALAHRGKEPCSASSGQYKPSI